MLALLALTLWQGVTWDDINEGRYPVHVTEVEISDALIQELFIKFLNTEVEYSYCIPGRVEGNRVVLEDELFRPLVLYSDGKSVLYLPCPPGTVGHWHNHPGPGFDNCGWSEIDARSFKNAISLYGEPQYVAFVSCWRDREPVLLGWLWQDLADFEEERGEPFKFYTPEFIRSAYVEHFDIDIDTLYH